MKTQFEAVSQSPTLQKTLQAMAAGQHVRQALWAAKIAAGGRYRPIYSEDDWNWSNLENFDGSKIVAIICSLHGVTPKEAGFGKI